MWWLLGRCAGCNSSDKNKLKNCASCGVFAYCSRECQTKDWHAHQRLCKEISSMADLGAKSQEGRAPIVAVSLTHAGIVCPGKPRGIPTNLDLLPAAKRHYEFSKEEEEAFESDDEKRKKNYLGEVDYKAIYDDSTIHHEQEWADLFRHPSNFRFLLDACWVSLKLADIYYWRSAFKECGEVLDKLSETTDLFKKHSTAHDWLDEQIPEYDELKHQENIFRCIKLKKNATNVPALREICAYEAKHLHLSSSSLDPRVQPCLYGLRLFLTSTSVPTVEEIYALPEEVMSQFSAKLKSMLLDGHYRNEVELMVCGNCNKQETALGEFKVCLRCNKAAYCGRKCQKASWKGHKKVCGKTG